MRSLDPAGEPIEEITRYIRTKIRLSRDNPKASRLFANEILHGATAIGAYLKGPLKELVDEKAAIISGWIAEGRLNPVDPHHLIFAIWATTQHYADFEPQVQAVVGGAPDVMTQGRRDADAAVRRRAEAALTASGRLGQVAPALAFRARDPYSSRFGCLPPRREASVDIFSGRSDRQVAHGGSL